MTATDVFWLSRQYNQAITQLQEALDLFPNDPQALSRLGRNYEQTSMFTEAIGEAERVRAEDAHTSISRALELDPLSVLAYMTATDVFWYSGQWPGGIFPRLAFEKERAEAALALEIDSNLASAHTEHALVYFYLDWDWQKAEEKFQRALSLNSNYAYAHQFYAYFLAAMGRTEEAHASIRRALELDPLSVMAYMTASDVLWLSRQYGQAITQLHEALDLFPNDPMALSRS